MQGDDGGLEEAGRDVRRRDRALGGRDARRQRPQCMMMPDDGAELKEGGREGCKTTAAAMHDDARRWRRAKGGREGCKTTAAAMHDDARRRR
jgi:hypothetical protein